MENKVEKKLRKFDTKVQHLKYKVMREVAREAWEGTLYEHLLDSPKRIIPGSKPTMRCCVYKERAIVSDRVKLAMGGDKENPNVIEVIQSHVKTHAELNWILGCSASFSVLFSCST